MILNKKLNLVIPVELEDGSELFVHSMPISRETFSLYWRVMAAAFADIQRLGMAVMSGPRVAMIALKEHAEHGRVWEGDDGVERGLLGEIRRLTNVILPGPKGWMPMPMTDAVAAGMISQEDMEEAEGAIVFFILSSAMSPRNVLRANLEATSQWWNSQVTSLNCTEYARSLPTLTAIDSSGAKVTPSSIPS